MNECMKEVIISLANGLQNPARTHTHIYKDKNEALLSYDKDL